MVAVQHSKHCSCGHLFGRCKGFFYLHSHCRCYSTGPLQVTEDFHCTPCRWEALTSATIKDCYDHAAFVGMLCRNLILSSADI